MANINSDYLVTLDIKNAIVFNRHDLEFFVTDVNTCNIFVNLVVEDSKDKIINYVEVQDPKNYQIELHIVKPNNDTLSVQGTLLQETDTIYLFDLPVNALDYIGSYKCEFRVTYNDHNKIRTSTKFKYRVKKSVYNNLDGIVDAPEYPIVEKLFEKLSDIDQYEEDRRTNELARQLAEKNRQDQYNELVADMTDSIEAIDNKVIDIDDRISNKEQAVDKLIVDTKADINDYKAAKDTEIDDYKTAKDTEINQAITNQNNKIAEAINNQNKTISDAITDQNNKIDTAIEDQNNRIEKVEASDNAQNTRLNNLESKNIVHESRMTDIEAKNVEQDNRLDSIEAVNVSQETRLDAIEIKNQQQDDRLLNIEKVNKRQDIDINCLFNLHSVDIEEEGNSVYLQNSTDGRVTIDNIQGNTMVNCNKEPDKEIILNGNINTEGYGNVTLTEGVNGGLVDVALEGNTMVNVCDPKDPVAITKSYTVETGNHVALQGEYDGKCRPVVNGNTLWIDNDTGAVLTAFDDTKNLRLQSCFEDKVVTQEMVDNGEELAENLGKYKVDYVISREDGTVGQTKTFYLNSPLLERDTIEQEGDNVVHVHRSELRAYETDDELTLPTDMTNTLVSKPSPQYEVISSNDTILCDSYVNGHLDMNSVVPIKKVKFGDNLLIMNYLYPSTNYTIQFESDNVGKMYYFTGVPFNTIQNLDINKGLNKFNIVTKEDVSILKGYISGIGFNASNIVVTEATDQDFGYFEGMKSVGECEDLEIVSSNKNLLNEDYRNFNNTVLDGYRGYKIKLDKNKSYSITLKLKEAVTLPPQTWVTLTRHCDPNKLGNSYLHLISNSQISNISDYTFVIDDYTVISDKVNRCIDDYGNTWLSIYSNSQQALKEVYDSVIDCIEYIQIEEGSISTDYIPHAHNTQTLTHEPLRSVGGIKDKYVLIDGKWYIERNVGEIVFDGSERWTRVSNTVNCYETKNGCPDDFKDQGNLICDNILYERNRPWIGDKGIRFAKASQEGLYRCSDKLPKKIVYELASPTYEPIDYNPFTVYSDTTHISNNSTIPANMTIKNTGYNCLLKPSTTYTVSSNLGLNTVTTPSTLTEDCLRFYDTDTSDITTMKDVLVLEGDYTTNGKPLPSHFSGIESAFEQEYDEAVGKYKVKIRVQNEDATKENYIEFYIDEPLRGIGDIKDKVYVQNDKVVVERKCGQRAYQDGDFGTYLTDKVDTVYQLSKPTYEEVEYNDVKLFIESFKNSTLFYNSNIPVTSTINYTYSVPLVDTVAQTASISDEQDTMIIDLAVQVAVMEMMLM